MHPSSGEAYGLVLVDLDEGVRAMGRARPAVPIGRRVRVDLADGVPTVAEAGP